MSEGGGLRCWLVPACLRPADSLSCNRSAPPPTSPCSVSVPTSEAKEKLIEPAIKGTENVLGECAFDAVFRGGLEWRLSTRWSG